MFNPFKIVATRSNAPRWLQAFIKEEAYIEVDEDGNEIPQLFSLKLHDSPYVDLATTTRVPEKYAVYCNPWWINLTNEKQGFLEGLHR